MGAGVTAAVLGVECAVGGSLVGLAVVHGYVLFFFFSSRRRHTRLQGDWSSDVCSSDLVQPTGRPAAAELVLRLAALAVGGEVDRGEQDLLDRALDGAQRERLLEEAVGKIGRASCRERV